MLKNSLMVLAASSAVLGYCDEQSDSNPCCLLPPEPVESCQIPVGYFYPAQYLQEDMCLIYTVYGEFIYWDVNFDAPRIANRASGPSFDLTGATTAAEDVLEFLAHHTGYQPGFSVGIGLGFPRYDNWEFNAQYTRIHSTTTNHFNAKADGILTTPVFLQLGFLPTSSVKSVQKLDLDFVSGTVGRDFYLSQRFILRPFVGLKSWWAAHEQKLLYSITNPGFTTYDPEFQITKDGVWGVGPYVGTQIDVLIWCGISAVGRAAVWPCYSRTNRYKVVTNFTTLNSTFFPHLVNEERLHGQPTQTQMFYEGSVGLNWGSYFCNCGYHLDIYVGWDFMTTWFDSYLFSSGTNLGVFYYEGLSTRVKLDF